MWFSTNNTMKTIYIIRHGETEYNKLGLVQGSGIDSNLNDTGKQQAHAFYETFKNVGFDKIYTSKLKRTHQSVRHFIQEGINWEVFEGLNEICWGNKEGKALLTDSDNIQYNNMLEAWRRGELHEKTRGGESPLEVQERQLKVLQHIMSQTHEKKVLICMHGRAMRIFLCLLLQYPLSNMDRFQHSNLCLYALQYEDEEFKLMIENSTAHLENLLAYEEQSMCAVAG